MPGRVLRVGRAQPASPWRPGAGAGAPAITVHEAGDEQGEAAWIAAAIDRLLGGSSFHSLDTGRADGHAAQASALADIAVLYRTDAQAGPLGQALTRPGSRSRSARTTCCSGVRRCRKSSARCAWPIRSGGDGRGGAVADRLAAAVLQATDRSTTDQAIAVDVLAAGEVLAPLARRCGADLERFLTEIALGAEADALDPRADAITLLTLHAARDWSSAPCSLAGCERGLLPLWLPGAALAKLMAGAGRQRPCTPVGPGPSRAAPAVRRHDPGADTSVPHQCRQAPSAWHGDHGRTVTLPGRDLTRPCCPARLRPSLRRPADRQLRLTSPGRVSAAEPSGTWARWAHEPAGPSGPRDAGNVGPPGMPSCRARSAVGHARLPGTPGHASGLSRRAGAGDRRRPKPQAR